MCVCVCTCVNVRERKVKEERENQPFLRLDWAESGGERWARWSGGVLTISRKLSSVAGSFGM